METERKNYNSIDVAKFVMAILVMTVHIDTGLPTDIHYLISNGVARTAVPFFFIASGFFFFNKIDNLQVKNLIKVLKRILILFFSWTFIYSIYMFKFFRHDEQPFLKWLLFLNRHLFLNPYGHLWFLPALMIGIGLGWCFLKLNYFKTGVVLGIFLYCIGVLGDSYYGLAIKNEYLKSFFEVYFQHFQNFRNGIFFGFIFTVLYNTFQNCSKKQLLILSVFSLVLLYAEYFFVEGNQYVRDHNMYFSLLVFTPAFFSILTKIRLKIPVKTALFLREYSIGIYFLHPLIKDVNFIDFGSLRFPAILLECILVIFIIKKFKIPGLSYLLK